jgi:hypothetical protein
MSQSANWQLDFKWGKELSESKIAMAGEVAL